MAPPIVAAAAVASTPCSVRDSSAVGSGSVTPLATGSSQSHGRNINITEETLKLIACVKARPALWHRKHLRQRVQVAHRGWEEIRETFNSADVTSLKTRWKTLRDSFRREVKRIEDGDQDKSTWPLYNTLSFLIGHFRTKENYCHGDSQSPDETNKEENKEHWQYGVDGEHDPDYNETIQSIYPEAKRRRYETVSTAECNSLAEESDPEDLIASFQNVSNAESYENLQMEAARSCEVIEVYPQQHREVTFKNRLRARMKTEPVELEEQTVAHDGSVKLDSDYNFLMSLHPFLRRLSGKKNLSLRIQIQQMIADALDED
ncbi:uncharacterized protein LOC128735345 [Sabethes cyaneus]|uniref:uncharacterized protein LOC128735345 n=1 Tax=Sabethes cyaneus TaxID=53552 RepID=UPI00237ED171|nr:uncharacterized protein LOC128735345 [Sabethes cyaneus]